MNRGCVEFRAALDAALAGPEGNRLRLAQDPHVAGCASCRAELAREQRLEHALGAVPPPAEPRELAASVLARLAPSRRSSPDELDALLARVPAPSVPPGLTENVLAGLGPERAAPRARPGWIWLLAAAAAGWLAWVQLGRRAAPEEIRQELARAALELEADEELLVYALERWELLHDEDLDLLLASLDPVDEFLMEVAEEELWLDELTAGGD